jgi:4-amino-4-deoxy-L-arabinose transferase-like glycosyltransferase
MPESKPNGPAGNTGPALAHPLAFTVGLCVLWLLPGLLGHDPWKPDEADTFGLVYQLLQSGDWVVPAIAGEPRLQNPPLFALSAAALAKALGGVLPLHDAARLASGLYTVLTFALVGLTARELIGPGRGRLAVLSLLGCLGLAVPAHMLVSDVAQLTGVALALYGLALSLRHALWGGLALGTGAGVGFLSAGLLAPGCLALTALLLPLVSPAWRTRRYLTTLAVAGVAALPWLLIWPLALYQRSPELFEQWFRTNALGRYLGGPPAAAPARPGYYLSALPWFTFPILPLALWGLWAERRQVREAPGLMLPLVLSLVILTALSLAHAARELYALPLLAPLAVLAVPGLLALRRGAAHAFWWFSILFGSFLVLMGWFEWSALELGFPGPRHRHWLRLQPAYLPGFGLLTFALALALSAFWVWTLLRLRRSPERPLIAWAAGVTVVWALGLTLFTGYLDTSKSYRSMVGRIVAALPERYDCVAGYNVGDAQRALLHYFGAIVTRPASTPGAQTCELLLVQGTRAAIQDPGAGWALLWEGARPGDRKELFRLYRRS